MITCFKNGQVLRDHKLVQEDFWVDGDRIVAPQPHAAQAIDVQGRIIAPGYIDIQINGAFGQDFSKKECEYDFVAKKLPQFGVTSFLATIVSSKREKYKALLTKGSEGKGANLLGFHLEGPFLNPKRKGAHSPECLCGFEDISSLEEFYGTLEEVKIVTLAPELAQAASHIDGLKKKGIIVAAGHTEASYEEVCETDLVTHLYNAMSPLQGRYPGAIGAALGKKGLYYSIIADGVHCHPTALKLAYQSKPEQMVLVSDAMPALGLGEGSYRLGDMDVIVNKGGAVLEGTDTLAGSVIGLDAAVRYLRDVLGCSVVEAIKAASLHPAKLLGIEKQKGTLNVGADADFILLNERLFVQAAYVGGINFYPA